MPDAIRRGCSVTTLLGIAAFVALTGAIVAAGLEPDEAFGETLHWALLALAAIEGPLAVGACVWLLGTAQRAGARAAPLVPEDPLLDVDRGAPVVGDAVDAAVGDGAVAHPRVEDRADRAV
jgi:hypothetical protein